MRIEQSLLNPEPKDVFKVSVWKTKPDASAAWWQRWFHRFVYLPFQDFAIRVMGIPPVKAVVVESDAQGNVKQTFAWFEDLGIYADEDQADAGCFTESDFYTRLPYGKRMPDKSAQYEYGAPTFPRRKNPKKWHRPVLSLIIKDRKREVDEQQFIKKCLKRLDQALD